MEMKERAKFRTEKGTPGVSTSESLSPWDYCRKRRRKKNGPNGKWAREALQAGGRRGTGRYQSAFQGARIKERLVKWNTSGTLRQGVPTAQSHRFPCDLP